MRCIRATRHGAPYVFDGQKGGDLYTTRVMNMVLITYSEAYCLIGRYCA